MAKPTLLKRFLIWKYKHISQRNFVLILSGLIGFIAGLISVILKNLTFGIAWLLEKSIIFSENKAYFILPVLGLALVYIFVKRISKKPLEPAIPSILYALSKRSGKIASNKMILPLITAPLTVGFGGSVGLLSPAIFSASAASSNIGNLFHISRKTRTLLIGCAAAGVIATSFKSPIAAVIFAIEVFSLDLTFASLLPLLIASLTSIITSYFFVGNEILFKFQVTEIFEVKDTLFYILLGIGTGVASIYFSKIYFAIFKFFDRYNTRLKKLLVGGLAIGIMLYFIPPLYGEGFSFINNLLSGNHVDALGKSLFDNYIDNIWIVIALLIGITIFKTVAMTTTFAAGGTGGIIIPNFSHGKFVG